ncbi:MAG: hypothetical protein ACK53L_19040, partial [Pirellulaceae bacterium]
SQSWRADTAVFSFACLQVKHPSHCASNTVRLWMPNFPDDTEGRDRVTYLLSEAFRQLQSERFSTVRAIASADQAASVAIFQRLGLRSVETGLVFKHPCHPA